LLIGLRVVGLSLFERDPNPAKEPNMATIEQLIEVLLPVLPNAEVTLDNDGEVIIRTGLTAPAEPA
jgi:hypothetical protein